MSPKAPRKRQRDEAVPDATIEGLVGTTRFADIHYDCKGDDDFTTLRDGSAVTLQEVADDGSCFFDSMARILTGDSRHGAPARDLGPLIRRLRVIGMGDEDDRYMNIVYNIQLERKNTRRFRGYEMLVGALDKKHKQTSRVELTMEQIRDHVKQEHKRSLQAKKGTQTPVDDFFDYCDEHLQVDDQRYADDSDYSAVVKHGYVSERFLVLVVNVNKASDIVTGRFRPLCLERDEISRIIGDLCNNADRRIAILARTGGSSKAKKSAAVHYQPVLFHIPGSRPENSKPIARIYDDEMLRNFISEYMRKCLNR